MNAYLEDCPECGLPTARLVTYVGAKGITSLWECILGHRMACLATGEWVDVHVL